jgi:hypothetical protein
MEDVDERFRELCNPFGRLALSAAAALAQPIVEVAPLFCTVKPAWISL